MRSSALCFALVGLVACSSTPSTAGDADAGTNIDAGMEPPPPPAREEGDGVLRESTTVGGVDVDRYTWTDSKGRTRTVSLKRQGATNGGYAVQMTYEVQDGANWRTVTLNGTGGGEQGFGYFVAHEVYRTFDDMSEGTIAALHGEDDSPLGFGFAVTGTAQPIAAGDTSAVHRFVTTYPKWGTVAPMPVLDATPRAASAHKKFVLPLTLQWVFQKGTDFPRYDVKLDLSEATAGQLGFDVRGPYGVLEFANADGAAALHNVQWGDSLFLFSTQTPVNAFLTTNSGWDWSAPLGNVRPFHALTAKSNNVIYELGLFELKLGTDTGLVYGGYSPHRSKTQANTGHALLSAQFPDYEWPFQSAQYSGVSAASPTTGKKFAWGSSALYGSTYTQQFLGENMAVNLTAMPANKQLIYRVCVVTGVSTYDDAQKKTLTRNAAESASPSCAAAAPL